MTNRIVLTIDGPTASGKGTLARLVGRIFDLRVLDTGLLYRYVGLACYRAGVDPHDDAAAAVVAERLAAGLTLEVLKNPELRSSLAGRYASVYSALPGVRKALLDFQRYFADHPPLRADGHHPVGAVLDGRDCGTIVCPMAPLKFYVVADVSERAHRRTKEFLERGENVAFEEVLRDLMARDHRDTTRAIAPTKPAEDAVLIDTTGKSAVVVAEEVAQIVEDVLGLARDIPLGEIASHPEERA
jgi:cytidylate kinase